MKPATTPAVDTAGGGAGATRESGGAGEAGRSGGARGHCDGARAVARCADVLRAVRARRQAGPGAERRVRAGGRRTAIRRGAAGLIERAAPGWLGRRAVGCGGAGHAAVRDRVGPFVTTADAERVERQLTQAGYQTARFRQQNGAGLYAVLLERIPTSREAQSLVTALREAGFPRPR